MGTLAYERPSEINTQTDLQLVSADATDDPEHLGAIVIPFPGVEITSPTETDRSHLLNQTLESLLFQDTNVLTAELQELGVFIEDLEGDNEGLGILIFSSYDSRRHVEYLRVDYSSEKDAITGVALEDDWYRGDGEVLAERHFGWAPGIEPVDEIVDVAEAINSKVEQARADRERKMRENAQTYGHLVMERAKQRNNN